MSPSTASIGVLASLVLAALAAGWGGREGLSPPLAV
jgi:hypothetical protein